MSAASQLKGWCPGALRPMLSGDGYLVRLRISGGVVSAIAARAIADCAQRYGNGLLDLSARANLQLRGVSEENLSAVVEALQAQGLIDASGEAEAVRNVLASPLAGLAPDAAFDIRPHLRALERQLGSTLFMRSRGRRNVITPTGEMLYKYACEALSKSAEF
jgi:precorrin-3B synthase